MADKPAFNKEELRARFNPEGSLLRRQQLVMLEMAKVLDRICKKHNIPYFLYAGSLLGAIRHDGFIPWDDDFDVALLRKDYHRLLKILPDELPSNIVLQSNDTDKNYRGKVYKEKTKRKMERIEYENCYQIIFANA